MALVSAPALASASIASANDAGLGRWRVFNADVGCVIVSGTSP